MNKKSNFENSIESTMHFLTHNSFLFTVIIMCLVHVTLLAITFFAGVPPLALSNVVSVIVYLFCIILCRSGHIMPVYISILLEVACYSALGVYYIGWKSGSGNFIFSIVPIIIFFGSYLFKEKKRWIIVVILALDFLMYALMYIGHGKMAPVFEISDVANTIMMLFSSFVMFFSVVFYTTIFIYSSERTRINLEQENKHLSAEAQEDALTNMLNRRGFTPVITKLMEGGETNHFCIAFFDIDNFKRINDTYGHDCGDEVLRHVSTVARKEMSGCEICRWGGEEFIILMKDYDMAVAKQKMEYLRKCVETTPTVFFNNRIPATITIGLEEYKNDYHEPDELIKVADERMYYGKQHGKNIVISEGGNVA